MNEDLKWLAENVHEWNDGCCAIQKDYTFLHGSNADQYCGVGEVCFTREQWQAARDELAKQKQWHGPKDGLPPVGARIEYRTAQDERFYVGEILCYHKESGNVWILEEMDGEPWTFSVDGAEFRPIRTEEDKAVDAMRKIIVDEYAQSKGRIPSELPESDSLDHYLRSLYRAGYRKQESE